MYDTLVLSGSSVKGIITLGALQYLYDNFILDSTLSTYIGTSSGAMISYLLAIGYSPRDIVTYLCTQQLLEKIQHFNIVAMIQGRGASSFGSIHEQLEKITIAKIGYLPTLQDLRQKYGKTLICVSHNITDNRVEYLGPDNYPELPCITALRMSANLPLIFEHFRYGNSYYIDGGVSDNFAIDLGDRMGKKVLGIYMETDSSQVISPISDSNILEYIYRLMNIPIVQSVEHKVNCASEKCRIFKLKCTSFSFFNFSLTNKDKLNMFSEGFCQIKEQF